MIINVQFNPHAEDEERLLGDLILKIQVKFDRLDTFELLDLLDNAAELNATHANPLNLSQEQLEVALFHAHNALDDSRVVNDREEMRFWKSRLFRLRDEYYRRGALLQTAA